MRVKIHLDVAGQLDRPGSAAAFTMGAVEDLSVIGPPLFVCITLALPSDTQAPLVYYLNSEGTLTLAGMTGQRNGQSLTRGGTILDQRADVPERGFTTYTIGVLLDHMSSFVVGTRTEESQAPAPSGAVSQSGDFSTGGSSGCFLSSL